MADRRSLEPTRATRGVTPLAVAGIRYGSTPAPGLSPRRPDHRSSRAIIGSCNFSAVAARNSENLNVVTSVEVAEAYTAHCTRQARALLTKEAAGWLEKARGANPVHPNIRLELGAAYALEGERASVELAEARGLTPDGLLFGHHSVNKPPEFRQDHPDIGGRELFEATFFAGLRKAGLPEE